MSILADFVLGTIKGMGGPDLKAWVDNLPGKIGEEIGSIVKQNVDQHGRLTEWGAEQVRKVLTNAPEQVPGLLPPLLKSVPPPGSDSLIPPYLEVLNLIVAGLRRLGRPVVLQGFLHSADCFSYWHFDPGGLLDLSDFTRHPTLDVVMCPMAPRVYLLDEQPQDARLVELNRQVRTDRFHALPHELYRHAFQVESIEEFEITGQMGITEERTLGIPIGAPGIPTMVASFDRAIEIQGEAHRQVEASIRSARSPKSNEADAGTR